MTGKESVYLRVYDLSDGAARTWSPVLLGKRVEGIWHTGVEVYGMEYFYGGGIVKMKPSDVETTYGISPLRVHHLGHSTSTQKEFEQYLLSVQKNFTRECYDLIKWNCNNFADHAVRFLLGKGIPAYILDLPENLTNTFMGKIIVNFIKMFSDAPAIDSEAADHPKQTLTLPNHFSKGRRNSCPGSPVRRAGGNRALTGAEQANFDALRRMRTVADEEGRELREGRADSRAGSREGREGRKRSDSRSENRKSSDSRAPSSQQNCIQQNGVQQNCIQNRKRTESLHGIRKRDEEKNEKPSRSRRSSVPTLSFATINDLNDCGSTAASSSSGTPTKTSPGFAPLSARRRLPPLPISGRENTAPKCMTTR